MPAEQFANVTDIDWAFQGQVWVTMIDQEVGALEITVLVTRIQPPVTQSGFWAPIKPTDVSFTATFTDTGDVLVNGHRVHPGMERSIDMLCSLADAVSINIPLHPGEYRTAHVHPR